jgi:hypothetical protein
MVHRVQKRIAMLIVAGALPSVHGFAASPSSSSPAFFRQTNPFKNEGLDIVPDFQGLFEKIQEVSPLARQVISGESLAKGLMGLLGLEEDKDKNLKWKTMERKPSATVHQIDKLDSFDGLSTPMFRFRASLKGPLIGEFFGRYIMDLEERKKWDAQIEQVREIVPINDLDSANIALGGFGDCSRLGIGYGQTKAALGITPREQLFMYGLQTFQCGSCLIWGTELDEKHNNLLPDGKRHTRAKSHLFSATLTPTGEDSFDVEYVLQLDIGGNIPKWLTTPVMIDTVKNLFNVASAEFSQGLDGILGDFLKQNQKEDQLLANKQLLLIPP